MITPVFILNLTDHIINFSIILLDSIVRVRFINSIYFIFLQVESSDRSALNKVVETVKTNFNERADEIKKHWGGSSLGNKSAAKLAKVQKAKDKEAAKM